MAANYVTVNSIIDSLELLTKQEDSYLSNIPRPMLIRLARKGLKEFVLKYTNEVRALIMPVKDDNSIDLPHDYVKYMRISYLTDCGKLVPIGVDTSISISNTYLLDNFDEILLDNNDVPLLGSGDSGINRECTSYSFDYSTCPQYGNRRFYSDYYGGNNQNINNSFLGEITFKEDTVNQKIQFSGTKLEQVVIEYSINPYANVGSLDDLEINIFFADALEKYVYNELVKHKRNEVVPANEKLRAYKDFKEALLEAKIHKNMPPLADIKKVTNLN